MDKASKDQVKKRFGARIRQLRKTMDLSQEEVALSAGLDRSYFGAIERGEKNVSLININRIADALKVGAGELFGAESVVTQSLSD
jgi:transcriptional regulator with XRE-family HTH domain